MNLADVVLPTWVKPVAYVILALSVLGSIYYAAHKAYTWAYTNGATATNNDWLARENVQVVTANAKIVQLENEAREKERIQEINVANIVDTYETDKQNAKLKTDANISNLNNGIIKLRDKYAASRQSTCPSQNSTTSTSTSVDNAETGTDLSGTAAEFLLKLTAEANEVVLQLDACQALLVSDRQICNATSP